MQIQNPWGALALLLWIPLVLLYLLKRRYREERVPSVFLWEKVSSQWEAAHPWQKWRRNLLFALQFCAIGLLGLALMQPVWRTEGLGSNSVALLDASLSMRAEDGEDSRFNRAKGEIEGLIRRMEPGEKMSILLCGRENRWLAVESEDEAELLGLLAGAAAEQGGNDLAGALELAAALTGEGGEEGEGGGNGQDGLNIYLFTDRDVATGSANVMLRNVAVGAANVAAESVSYSRQPDGSLSALGLLRNYGPATRVSVELWGDGGLLDAREVDLPEDGGANVLFEELPGGLGQLTLAFSEGDALNADNAAYCAVQEAGSGRVLLLTERNVYLEKAILLREDVALYKGGLAEELPLGQYDLVVVDGEATADLPEGQNIWLLGAVTGNEWFVAEAAELTNLRTGQTPLAAALLEHVDLGGLRLAEAAGLYAASPYTETLASLGDAPLIIAEEREGVKRLAFGFDLHDSNLPLQKDFPILVQNVLNWFIPSSGGFGEALTVGDNVALPLDAAAESYSVSLPDGSALEGLTERNFADSAQPGFYTLRQYNGEGALLKEQYFAVNTPRQGEGELRTASRQGEEDDLRQGLLLRNRDLYPFFLILLLALLLLEWWIYHKV